MDGKNRSIDMTLLRPAGAVGNISNNDPLLPKTGVLWGSPEGSMAVYSGAPEMRDNMTGTNASNEHFSPLGGEPGTTTRINGGGGEDTVYLPGRREDYVPKMPNAGEYPSLPSKEWEGKDDLYGTGIVLHPVGAGQRFSLRNVERVVFTGDIQTGSRFLTPDTVRQYDSGIKAGTVQAASMAELVAAAQSGITPREEGLFRMAATREAQKFLEGKNGVSFEDAPQNMLDNPRERPGYLSTRRDGSKHESPSP